MEPYIIVYTAILIALALFLFGPWRYDLVSLIVLFSLVLIGIISFSDAFYGFSHPAVITVISVLILGKALINAGIISIITRRLYFVGDKLKNQIAVLGGLVGILSGFMNNIGALASFIPVAMRIARKTENNASRLLMPLAFASVLGGMITMIGTPSNIIIALFRMDINGEPFGIFDFFFVGFGVALVGIIFISLVGWKLVPQRQPVDDNAVSASNFRAEILIYDQSKIEGKTISDLMKLSGSNVKIESILKKKRLAKKPKFSTVLEKGDVLVVIGEVEEITSMVDVAKLKYAHPKRYSLFPKKDVVVEAVVSGNSSLVNKKVETSALYKRFNVSVLGIARKDKTKSKDDKETLERTKLVEGDVIVLQGSEENIQKAMRELNCYQLKERWIRFGQTPRIIPAIGIFLAAILSASFGVLPVEIALASAALLTILIRLVKIDEAYSSIDWPIVILLGAMIPVGLALDATGGARVIADSGLNLIGGMSPSIILLCLMIITMALSNVINNAATAVLMAPIGIGIAQNLSLSVDPFLMAVAVAAAASFMTPIGHQSNALVMSKGGYKFGDYWRLGLPLSIITIIVGLPLILLFWPF